MCMAAALLLAAGCTKETAVDPDQGEDFSKYLTLGIYKGIEIAPIEVTEEDVQSEIDYMLEHSYDADPITDRPVEQGDTVNLDYTGYLGEEAFEGGSALGALLTIGSGDFIPGFEEGLVGAVPGRELELSLTFPEEYWDEKLAGAEARFLVTVNYIEGEKRTPELTDAWIEERTNGDLHSVEEYRTWLREQMEQDALNQRRSLMLKTVIESSEIKGYPEDRLQAMKDEISKYYEDYASYQYGMTLEEYTASMGQSLEAFMLQVTEAAQESVAQTMVTLTIAKQENIDVTEEECNQGAVFYGYQDFDEFAEYYGEERAREVILMDKVVDWMLGLR